MPSPSRSFSLHCEFLEERVPGQLLLTRMVPALFWVSVLRKMVGRVESLSQEFFVSHDRCVGGAIQKEVVIPG
jgi:hypothetical protein